MPAIAQQRSFSSIGAMIFRIALFAAGASLSIFIVYKYATSLHTLKGLYAFLFPLSAVLAAAGMVLAVRPGVIFSSSVALRAGVGAVAFLWLATGALCLPAIAGMIQHSVWGAFYAGFHLTTQHFFLSSVILAFAFAPNWMARKLGVAGPGFAAGTSAEKSVPAKAEI